MKKMKERKLQNKVGYAFQFFFFSTFYFFGSAR